MISLFMIAYILFLIIGCGIIFGIYKLIGFILKKMSFRKTGIKILRIFITIISLLFFFISLKIGIWHYENPSITDKDYNRAIYSVTIYNSTDIEIDGLEICAGENRIPAQTVDDIQPKEYRKINIPTHESSFVDSIKPPYNVFVREAGDINNEICVGYFGIGTGGTELVNLILDDENNIVLEKEDHSSGKYIKLLRKDRKDQDLLSWYD